MISSTWRYDSAGLFSAKRWGIPFIDVVPDMPDKPRWDEIFDWLKTRENVHRFAVLDDQDDEGTQGDLPFDAGRFAPDRSRLEE